MAGKDVEIVEYSPRVDFFNALSHGAGALFSLAALVLLLLKAQGIREGLSAALYGITMVAVYTVSAVYHAKKPGDSKRKWRIADHSTVPFLIAGTATPCALISLYEISSLHGIAVLVLGWFCAAFGAVSKLFFFNKLKAVTMAVYIFCGSVMLLSAVPRMGELDSRGFYLLVAGSVLYLIGALLCGIGKKYQWLHVVFHLFVMAATATHFYVIYTIVM